MPVRVFRVSVAAAVLALAFPIAALASPPAQMDANPEVQYYPCPQTWDVTAYWTVAAAGISWSVNYGDGTSSGNKPISQTSINHLYHPHLYYPSCASWMQTFKAIDSLGGSAIDYTRLTYSLP